MKKLRLLLITLCVSVLMGSMAVTAYAGGGEEWDGLDPVEPLPTETVDPSEGFTEDGNLVTRDLLYDKATNKQFITVQTSGGNTFYIVIDYDKPTDEDGEQYHTYFLNMVDEADLLAAMQAAGGELPECSCADKCAVGVINTDCTVCAVNMSECQGKAPFFINLFTMWGVRVMTVLVFTHRFGVTGVWISMTAELITRGIVFLIRLLRGRWLKMPVLF